MPRRRVEVEQQRPDQPLADALRLTRGAVVALRKAKQADDATMRALEIRAAMRLISDAKRVLLGIP